MLDNLYRDEPVHPLVKERFTALRGYFAAAQGVLLQGRKLRGGARRRTGAALGHAISFPTWKSLVREQELSDEEAAALLYGLVAGAG
jgi:hypothetical protein